jgi:hypothetical protein
MRRLIALLLVCSLLVPGAVGAQAFAEAEADLTVQQPHYVDSDVTTDTSGNTTTYRTAGKRLYLEPQNFNESRVVDYGVGTNGPATLTRDQALGTYQFTADEPGTYEVFWVVSEQREVVTNNTTAVQDVRVRYSARINSSQTSLEHLPPGTLDETREDAANWSAFASAVKSERVAGEDANMEAASQLAINLLRLRYHPLSAFAGNFTQIVTLLVLTLGGLIFLALAIGWHAFSRYHDVSELREMRQLDSERADLEDELDTLEMKETLATLEGMDWNHLFPDDVARAFREAFGETVLDGWLRLQSALAPRRLVRDRLQAMSEDFVAVTDDRVPQSDGGVVSSPGEGVSATLYPRGETPEDADARVHELGDPADWLIDAVDWNDPELISFNLAESDIDHDNLDTTLESPTIDDLVEEWDIQLERDFDGDRELFAQYIGEFLRSVADHDITDPQGRPRRIRVAANVFLRLSRVLRDRHELPTATYMAEWSELLATSYSTEDEIDQYVDDVETGRVGGD